ncbi:12732_t:CDS:1, partial [Acaulospora colombiana]
EEVASTTTGRDVSTLSSSLGKEGRVREYETSKRRRRVEEIATVTVEAGSEEGGRSRKRRKVAEERPVDGQRQEQHEESMIDHIDDRTELVGEIGMTGLVVCLMVRLCQSRLDTMWHGECVEKEGEEEEREEVILAKRYVSGEKAILASCLESWREVGEEYVLRSVKNGHKLNTYD